MTNGKAWAPPVGNVVRRVEERNIVYSAGKVIKEWEKEVEGPLPSLPPPRPRIRSIRFTISTTPDPAAIPAERRLPRPPLRRRFPPPPAEG